MAVHKRNITFTDSSSGQIKTFYIHTKSVRTIVGSEKGYRDGSQGLLIQPAGVAAELNTLFICDVATATVRMVTGVSGLINYLEQLKS